MKRSGFTVMIAAVVLLASVLACGGSMTTANIGDAWMSTDNDGNNRTTTFSQDAVFYAQVDLRNAPDDTKLKASWIAVAAEDTDPNLLIDEVEYTSGDGLIHFDLENDNLWPLGQYKVDIYLNDTLSKTLTFEVR
ncbi:MAG: hypothetical protein V1755_00420 [Chloroflexota bacterium]